MTENKIHYCTVGTVQRKFGLYLTGAGSEVTKPGDAYPHEYHSSDYYFTWRNGRRLPEGEYQLLYIRDGRGVIEFERGKGIPVSSGSVIILHPGEWHRYRPHPKVGWSEAYIGIGGDYLDNMIREPFFPAPPTIIKIEPDTRFDRELMSLVSEIQFDSAEHPYTLALKTAALMMSLCESHAKPHGKSAHNVTIRKANLYISAHLGETIDFAALAQSYNMGYTLFRRCFSDYNGLAPLEYQNAMRIRRAMGLLTGSNLPVARIAADVGFHSAAYFSKYFHARTGMTPIQYRISRHNERTGRI